MKMLAPGLLALALLSGCQTEKFSAQPLQTNDYDQTFCLAKETFSHYFSIACEDPVAGTIVGSPKECNPVQERLLGCSDQRQIACMRVRRVQGCVLAEVRVECQRQQGVAAVRTIEVPTVNRDVPNYTPAQESAAVLACQNQTWQTTGRDSALERTILNDLRNRLACATAPPPPQPMPAGE